MKTLPNLSFTQLRPLLPLALATALIPLATGCVVAVAGAVAGAAYGTVSYVNNSLVTTDPVSLDRAWRAADTTVRGLGFSITVNQKDALTGRLEARTAQNEKVLIKFTRQGDALTKVEISVGTFDSSANRATAQLIYERMKARY